MFKENVVDRVKQGTTSSTSNFWYTSHCEHVKDLEKVHWELHSKHQIKHWIKVLVEELWSRLKFPEDKTECAKFCPHRADLSA